MPRQQLVECRFYIPQRRDKDLSDGRRHHPEKWEWLYGERARAFQGYTLAPGWYQGLWEHPAGTGRLVTDLSRQFIVAVPTNRVGRLRAILSQACAQFQQRVIYLTVDGKVEFVNGSNAN